MTRSDNAFGLLVLTLCLAAILARCAPPVEAQADDALTLDVVRLAHHESQDPLADAPGIHAVLVNGAAARGISTHAMATSYAPRFFAGTSARPWLLALELTCARPRGYPRRLRWDVARCAAVVALARSLDAPRCAATWWGSSADYRSGPHAAAHARDVFVDCGEGARNLFSRGPT